MGSLDKLKTLLDQEVRQRNNAEELCIQRPDPLLVATKYKDEYIALICALFAYGSAAQIVKFLENLDFSLLEESEKRIEQELKNRKYRFQNSDDVTALFVALRRLKMEASIKEIVKCGYMRRGEIRDGLWELIGALHRLSRRESTGYRFLIGAVPDDSDRCAPFKRYMMYFRWMVRKDFLDMGLWEEIDPASLIIPLDTHTQRVSLRLGLLKRKSYDMRAALELTARLREFDPKDPVKYDFALYRLGQESAVDKLEGLLSPL
jgi:uncharacterized protein (TIGR02757 family)